MPATARKFAVERRARRHQRSHCQRAGRSRVNRRRLRPRSTGSTLVCRNSRTVGPPRPCRLRSRWSPARTSRALSRRLATPMRAPRRSGAACVRRCASSTPSRPPSRSDSRARRIGAPAQDRRRAGRAIALSAERSIMVRSLRRAPIRKDRPTYAIAITVALDVYFFHCPGFVECMLAAR